MVRRTKTVWERKRLEEKEKLEEKKRGGSKKIGRERKKAWNNKIGEREEERERELELGEKLETHVRPTLGTQSCGKQKGRKAPRSSNRRLLFSSWLYGKSEMSLDTHNKKQSCCARVLCVILQSLCPNSCTTSSVRHRLIRDGAIKRSSTLRIPLEQPHSLSFHEIRHKCVGFSAVNCSLQGLLTRSSFERKIETLRSSIQRVAAQ